MFVETHAKSQMYVLLPGHTEPSVVEYSVNTTDYHDGAALDALPVVPERHGGKYYLGDENDRNTRHGLVYMELIRRAFGLDDVVMVGHHFVFAPKTAIQQGDLTKLNEIPSADTVLFDHPIMSSVFGTAALPLMARLSQVPCEERDDIVKAALAALQPVE